MITDTDLTYPELSAHTKINGVTIAEILPDGRSLSLKDTIAEDVVSAEPTGPVQEPKQVEAVLDTENVAGSKEPTDINAPKQIAADYQVEPHLGEDIKDKKDSVMTENGDSVSVAESELGTAQSSENTKVAPSASIVEVDEAVITTENVKGQTQKGSGVSQEPPMPSAPAQSIPPHLRPSFPPRAPRQHGLHSSRHMPPSQLTQFNEAIRSPRLSNPAYEPRSYAIEGEQYARMTAQLMKTKHDLDNERVKNVSLRKDLEEEYQRKFDAASSTMLTSLIREQADAISAKASFEAKERELHFREQTIQQLEVFLTKGQKYLINALEKNGDRSMSTIQAEHIRREAVLATKKNLADVEATVHDQIKRLNLRAQAHETREKCYKALIRESLLAELNESVISEEKLKEIAEAEFSNGFAAGKQAGRKEVPEDDQRGFLEGYRVSRRTQILLSKVRKGDIQGNCPELDFLYDVDHPYNPCTMGERLGRMERDDADKEAPNGHATRNVKTTVDKKPLTNGRPNGVVEKQPEEPIRRMPPPRRTFAAELRGPSTMHNGHVVLANNAAASSSPANGDVGCPVVQHAEGESLIDLM